MRTAVDTPAPLLAAYDSHNMLCEGGAGLTALQTETYVGPKCKYRSHTGIGPCPGAMTAQEGAWLQWLIERIVAQCYAELDFGRPGHH